MCVRVVLSRATHTHTASWEGGEEGRGEERGGEERRGKERRIGRNGEECGKVYTDVQLQELML